MHYSHKTAEHNGNRYDCVCSAFQDVLEIMIYKNNRLCKVFDCALTPNPGGIVSEELTLATVSPRAIVGSNSEDAEGNLYAQIISSTVLRETKDDFRLLIVGFGHIGPKTHVTDEDRQELQVVQQLLKASRIW